MFRVVCGQILSMIEEAAGTRLYECKKQVAQKTIEKKDAKLKEINDVSVTNLIGELGRCRVVT